MTSKELSRNNELLTCIAIAALLAVFAAWLVGSRNLLVKGKRLRGENKKVLAETLARSCRMRHTEVVERESPQGLSRCELSFGVVDVRLPGRPDDPLRMVVVKGFGMEVLTSHITHAAKRIYGVAEFFYYALADGIARIFSKGFRWKDAPDESPNESTADETMQMRFNFDG